jgi:very-short-patch-repair endonuclease
MLLACAGIPPVPQFTVRGSDGAFLARVDFAYPDLRIAIEYDGVWHADRDQLRRDRRRLNGLVAEGWAVLHLTAADLRDPEGIVRRVRRLIAARETGEPGVRRPR